MKISGLNVQRHVEARHQGLAIGFARTEDLAERSVQVRLKNKLKHVIYNPVQVWYY